jgi:DNA-binding IclR family transcriptional regulator
MQLLALVAQSPRPLTLTEMARELGLAKSTVHALCVTMLEEGYLRREGSNFRPGPMAVVLAHGFRSSSHVLSEFLRAVDEFPLGAKQSIVLSTLVRRQVMYLGAKNATPCGGLVFCEGTLSTAYLTASGKALLAWRDDVAHLYQDERFSDHEGQGPQTLQALLDELQAIRSRGWSMDDEGVRKGLVSYAAPVFDRRGHPTAAVALCVAKSSLSTGESTLPRRIVGLAQRLSLRVGGVHGPKDGSMAP